MHPVLITIIKRLLLGIFTLFLVTLIIFGSISFLPGDFTQAVLGQAALEETVAAFRKDVTQKLYGGDVTRKNKLLDKQKKGKKRMKQFGKVDIPQNTFLNALRMKEN